MKTLNNFKTESNLLMSQVYGGKEISTCLGGNGGISDVLYDNDNSGGISPGDRLCYTVVQPC